MSILTDITRQLQRYCFSHFRKGYQDKKSSTALMWVYRGARKAHIKTHTERLDLPNQEQAFYVFTIPKANIRKQWRQFTRGSWHHAPDLLTSNTELYIYEEHGRRCCMTGTYVHVLHDHLIIAIEALMAIKTLRAETLNEIFDNTRRLMLYIREDKSRDTLLSIEHVQPTTAAERSSVFIDAASAHVVFRNGRPCIFRSLADVKLNDQIELITYTDYVCTITLDMDVGYTSSEHGDMVLLHIPKADNPNNSIIPWDLCTLVAYQTSNTSNGWYIEQWEQTEWQQLTHGDIGIPKSTLAIHPTKLSLLESELTYKVICRAHDLTRTIGTTANYLDALYTHTDAEIIDIITGETSPDIGGTYWEGDELEQSAVGDAIHDELVYTATAEALVQYIDILGYHNAMAIVCPRIRSFKVDATSQHTFALNVPYAFNEKFVRAHVFLDGLKLDDDYVNIAPLQYAIAAIKRDDFANMENVGHRCVLQITEDVDFTPEGTATYRTLVVELFEDPDITPIHIRPVTGSDSVTFDPTFMEIYQQQTITPDDTGLLYLADDTPFAVAWTQMDYTDSDLGTLADGVFTFHEDIVAANDAGPTYTEFLIQSTVNQYRWADWFTTVDAADEPMRVWLQVTADDDTVVPVIGTDFQPMVYLNGHALTRDIDYTLRVLTSDEVNPDDWVMAQIIIQNVLYQEETNIVEVYLMHDVYLRSINGFAEPDYPYGVKTKVGFTNALTVCATRGESTSVSHIPTGKLDRTIDTTDAPDTGYLVELRQTIPRLFDLYLQEVENGELIEQAKALDITRLDALAAYFEAQAVEEHDDVLVIDGSHTIYSIYVHYIIRDFLAALSDGGNELTTWVESEDYDRDELLTKVLPGDADPWIEQYDWIKAFDVVFDGDHTLDYRFIDVYPSYHTRVISTAYQRPRVIQFIQDLIWLLIDTDALTDVDLGDRGYH